MHDLPAPGPAARATAWLGGAVFVVSLGATLVAFLFRMQPAPGGTNAARPAVFDILLFTAFALHHSIFARPSVKRRLIEIIPPHLERTLYVWVASLLLLGVLLWWEPLPGARIGTRAGQPSHTGSSSALASGS
jgi:hypothetical protein